MYNFVINLNLPNLQQKINGHFVPLCNGLNFFLENIVIFQGLSSQVGQSHDPGERVKNANQDIVVDLKRNLKFFVKINKHTLTKRKGMLIYLHSRHKSSSHTIKFKKFVKLQHVFHQKLLYWWDGENHEIYIELEFVSELSRIIYSLHFTKTVSVIVS